MPKKVKTGSKTKRPQLFENEQKRKLQRESELRAVVDEIASETPEEIVGIRDRSNVKKLDKHLEFMITDWRSYHEMDQEEQHRYVVQLFGRTEDDHDVCLKVAGFTPYFYVEVPSSWGNVQIDDFVSTLKSKATYISSVDDKYSYDISKSLIAYQPVMKKKFYNFVNNKSYKFVMLVFKSLIGMQLFANLLNRKIKVDNCMREPRFFNVYESNIEPHIRLMHINNISSCGWVKISTDKLYENNEYSNCDYSYIISWKNLQQGDNDDRIASLKIMGYDIECISCDENFPQANRLSDKIIQIGVTMFRYGSMQPYEKHILVLGPCGKVSGANVIHFKTERALLRGFAKLVRNLRPDLKAGYNNKGFDDNYIYDRIKLYDKIRAKKEGIAVELMQNSLLNEFTDIMGKLNNQFIIENESIEKSLTQYVEKNLSSSALGDNILKFFDVPGIITVDMLKVIQRDHKLNGYKLDDVSANFINEKIVKFSRDKSEYHIYTRSTKALDKDSYIQIMVYDAYSGSPFNDGAKFYVKDIRTVKEMVADKEETFQVIVTEASDQDIAELNILKEDRSLKLVWTFAKDDMHHTLINKYYKEANPKKVALVAKYCLKDCSLVNLLLAKLEIIVNSVGMAKVCHVPLSYLFMRGQGVKIFSLVSKKCREKGFLIPLLRRKKQPLDGDSDDTYEGATVINPKPAVYLSPIGVLDYNSLYPQSMRERNLTPECYVNDKSFDNLRGYIYHDIHIICKDSNGKIIRNLDGSAKKEHHRFAQEIVDQKIVDKELENVFNIVRNKITIERAEEFSKLTNIDKTQFDAETETKILAALEAERMKKFNKINGQYVRYGILPEILTELLNKRKEKNAELAKAKDAFLKAILNSLQLAYKVTANSLYGQTGAKTSPIFFIVIAACTTCIGRERLHFAKKVVVENFPGAEVIYGDTDSIFINFHVKDDNGVELFDKTALIKTIELAKKAAKLINSLVASPQCIVYEKTLWPFILVAKKKYVGMLYGEDPNVAYMKAMGIVLKRRDNAPIVKIVVGGIIDYIMKNADIDGAVRYTKEVVTKLLNGHYPMDKFIISKTLKAKYKKPKTITHKVLADRMAERDPGNKPQVNDRIPFVYVITKHSNDRKKKVLQGELVEHPEYVIANKLKIDYLYYLEHQIIEPASQFLELLITKRKVEKLFGDFVDKEIAKRIGQKSLDNWMTEPDIDVDVEDNNTYRFENFEKLSDKEKTYIKTKKFEKQSLDTWLHNLQNKKLTVENSDITDSDDGDFVIEW